MGSIPLSFLFGRRSPGVRIALPISQTELASWVGISRKAVTNTLQVLRHRGWIQTGRKAIIVKDLDALRARAT